MPSTAALELLVQLDDRASKGLDKIGDKGGRMGDLVKGGALIAGGAILGLGAALVGAAGAAAEEQVGIDRLNQTLENSIPNWDGNTEAVEAYIAKQEQLAFADDELRDSLNALVRQTGDLTEAQELQTVAMDLARATGIDLATATKAVGKVDNDSIGILKKLGIQVTENMTKEEALTAIRQRSAGQAEAYANTTAGAMERIQNTLGNVVEDIGGVVLGLVEGPLQEFADWFQSPEVQAAIQEVAAFIGETLAGAFGLLQGAINFVLPIIQPFVDAIVNFFSEIQGGGDFMSALAGYFNDLGTAIQNAWNIVAPALGTLIGNIIQWIQDNGPTILANLLTWAQSFATWVWQDALPALLKELGSLIQKVWTWITENGPGILAQLGTWATQFWKWIVDVTPTVLSELGKLVSSVWNWIVAEGPGILLKLGEWGLAFIGWVLPLIPPLLLELGKVLLEITNWILFTAIPGAVVELVKLGAAFLNWIAKDVLPKLGEELAKIWNAITGWFAGILGLTPAQAEPVGIAAAVGIGTGFTTEWTSVEDDCVRAYCGLPEACETAISADVYDTGCFAAIGIADGFCDTWVATEADRCVAAVSTLPAALNVGIHAKSPSRDTMPVGANLAEGIAAGFMQMFPTSLGLMIGTLSTTMTALDVWLMQNQPGIQGAGAGMVDSLKEGWGHAFAALLTRIDADLMEARRRIAEGVTVGTTTVYNGSGGVPPGLGGGQWGLPGGSGGHLVQGAVGAGGGGGGLSIGVVNVYAGPGTNGRMIADSFIDELEYQIGTNIAQRNGRR